MYSGITSGRVREQNTYNQLLDVNVTKGYKKAPPTTEEDITLQDKTIATKA